MTTFEKTMMLLAIVNSATSIGSLCINAVGVYAVWSLNRRVRAAARVTAAVSREPVADFSHLPARLANVMTSSHDQLVQMAVTEIDPDDLYSMAHSHTMAREAVANAYKFCASKVPDETITESEWFGTLQMAVLREVKELFRRQKNQAYEPLASSAIRRVAQRTPVERSEPASPNNEWR